MMRYPDQKRRYVYRCEECGHRLPNFQGLFWFVRDRKRGDGVVEVPYCPECKSESITAEAREGHQ